MYICIYIYVYMCVFIYVHEDTQLSTFTAYFPVQSISRRHFQVLPVYFQEVFGKFPENSHQWHTAKCMVT